ncbi:hypothetical protein [Neolewinella xylanilytica]|uniref:hypothetical protein n=1 Tax=Neolewinella xylanilytica TaxID=1514080 RepID=UPI0011B0207F|nr:hypothetical protein [Neolewinella xylanilytica]
MPLPLLLSLLVVSWSCQEDDPAILEVYVTNPDGVQEGVSITLDPGGLTGLTDSTGLLLFPNIPPLDYTVVASHPVLGTNSALVSVAEGVTSRASINLSGRFDQPPGVAFIFPGKDDVVELRETETLYVEARVTDDNDPPGTIAWQLSSSMDSLLGSGTDSLGLVALAVSDLKQGDHTLTLTARDSKGFSAADQVTITVLPALPTMTLHRADPVAAGIRLEWSRWKGSGFIAYNIYRGDPGENALGFLRQISHLEDTVFNDETVPFNRPVDYRVTASYDLGGGYFHEEQTASRTTTFLTDRITLEATVDRMLADPKRGKLYGISRELDRLYIMDVDRLAVTKTLPTGSKPEDLTLSPNGDTLYVAASGGTSVTVFDLEKETRSHLIYLPTGRYNASIRPLRIAALSGGRLAMIAAPSDGLYLYRPGDDTLTLVSVGHSFTNNLVADPLGEFLYVTDHGGGGQQAYRYESDPAGNLILADVSEPSSGSLRAVLSSDGRYLFFGNAMLRADKLTEILGSFGSPDYNDVRLTNGDGSKVMTPDTYYSTATLTPIGPVRAPNRVLAYDPVSGIAFHHEYYSNLITLVPFR